LDKYAYPFLGYGIGVAFHEQIPVLIPNNLEILKEWEEGAIKN